MLRPHPARGVASGEDRSSGTTSSPRTGTHVNLASTTGLTTAVGPKLDFSFSGARARPQPTLAPPLGASLDPIVASQVRFNVVGAGPIAARAITPASEGAAALVQQTPTAVEAVRGVLQLVEHVAGGPAASAAVKLDGVSFASSQQGLAANTWRAHADAPRLRAGLAQLSQARRSGVLERLATNTAGETSGMLANVASGWINVGPTASSALLARAGAAATTAVSTQQLADSVRILLHESVHAVDTEPANLPPQAMHGVWESLAEARTMTMPQLQAARAKLGLDAVVPDAALAVSLRHRPYADAERTLAGVLKTAGIAPGSAAEQGVLRATAHDAVELLTAKVASTTGYSPKDARSAIATAFAESMAGSR